MKRRLLVVSVLSIALLSAFSYTNNSKAAEGLQSKGRIIYDATAIGGDKIIIDANDHVLLKNNIDANAAEIEELKEFFDEQELLNEQFEAKDIELQESIDDLNERLGGLQFSVDENGNPQWKEQGSDTWNSF